MPVMNAATASEVDAPAKASQISNPVLLGPAETGNGGGENAIAQHTGEVTTSTSAETGTDAGPEPSTDVYVPSAPASNAPDGKASSTGGLLSRFTENFTAKTS